MTNVTDRLKAFSAHLHSVACPCSLHAIKTHRRTLRTSNSARRMPSS